MLIEIDPVPSPGAAVAPNARQSHQPESVAGDGYLRFRNDHGVREICIGVKEFKCIGESPSASVVLANRWCC